MSNSIDNRVESLEAQVQALTDRMKNAEHRGNKHEIHLSRLVDPDVWNGEHPPSNQPAAVCPKCNNSGYIKSVLDGVGGISGVGIRPCDCGRAPIPMNTQPAANKTMIHRIECSEGFTCHISGEEVHIQETVGAPFAKELSVHVDGALIRFVPDQPAAADLRTKEQRMEDQRKNLSDFFPTQPAADDAVEAAAKAMIAANHELYERNDPVDMADGPEWYWSAIAKAALSTIPRIDPDNAEQVRVVADVVRSWEPMIAVNYRLDTLGRNILAALAAYMEGAAHE